jgi:hypothetical protein
VLEFDPAMTSPIAQGEAILLADPSMSGPAIAAALRARSFAVIEVRAESLAARAFAESPWAILVDVDQPGAIEAVERARELLSGSAPEIFCLGDPLRAAELGETRAAGRVFARPVDVSAVVAAVLRVASPEAQGELGMPSFAQRRPTLPPRNSESELPPPFSELPSTADPLEVAAILPSGDEISSPSKFFLNELSPELEGILAAAEQRVATQHRSSSIPSPEEELDLLLPADLLSSLDEPLDPEDESIGTGSGIVGTGVPRLGTGASGSRTSSMTSGETTTGEGAADVGRGSAFGRTPISVMTPQPPESRFEIRQITGTREAIAPPRPLDEPLRPGAAPQGGRRSPSTFPPDDESSASPGPLDLMTAARDWPPLLDPLPLLRPQSAASIGKPGVFPSIRDGLPAAKPGAVAADGGAAIKTTASLFLPAAFGSEVTVPDRSVVGVAPGASSEIGRGAGGAGAPEAGRGTSAQELTSPGRSSPPSARTVVLGDGEALLALARAVAARLSGALSIGAEPALRRIVIHDGDIVTAGSSAADESLLAFLAARGDLPREVAVQLTGKLPSFGRHAGAALIAHGYLGQDDLWPVLRAHAEWIIGRAILCESGTWELEPEPPGRLKAEPNVFGGATGAEVLVEQVRRVVPPQLALRRIGGASARLAEGARRALLTECALRREEEALMLRAPGRAVAEILKGSEPELANVIYALVALGVLDALASAASVPAAAVESVDPLDVEALRLRVRARAALVEDGDYFSLLGVARTATGYEVRRAYLDLRRAFEPSRVLTAATADLADEVRLIVFVLDEAYEILRDPHRRERYRKAIESGPP